uniref:Transcription factor bHLH144 n=1 Tax=Anthurium amnicola TaxID=1678845 RepID=A0A1D1YBB2_9ARAE
MDGYNPSAAFGDYYSYEVPVAPSFDATPAAGRNGYPTPLNGFELQPSETCPKNYIIFDQTENKNLIMFHPALAQKFSHQNLDFGAAYGDDHGGNPGRYRDNQDKSSSSFKEDSDDIDALLSLEEDEDYDEAEDDDVVSTGRTPGHHGSTSTSSVRSTEGSKSHRLRFPSESSTSDTLGGKKKERMRKMVKTLRGIIPGGDQMDTPAILDEAVRYLKSLKVEVKKLQNSKN